MKTLLLVEDELDILENNRRFFKREGYHVLTAENIAQAKEHLVRERPGAVVLDIMLPDGSGLDLLSEMREAGSKIPVIMLTAWGKSSDIAHGLRLGANDYVSKPFTYEELLARVETMFRNVEQIPERIEKGEIMLKIRSMEIHIGNNVDSSRSMSTKLPPVEFYLLQLFMENEGRDLKADYLYEQVWGADMANDPNAVKNAVSRLRKKIDGSGYVISNVRGTGYCFERKV